MRIIKCGVHCQYWNSPINFEIEVDDNATEEEINEQLFEAAIQEASFDYWIEDDDPAA